MSKRDYSNSQYNIFDYIVIPTDYSCDSCKFDKCGSCDCEKEDTDDYCVLGSNWKPKRNEDNDCNSFKEYLTKYHL